MPMDSPASDYPLVNIPETSAVYFKNGNPVRQSGAPLNGLVRVMESESGKFLGTAKLTMKAAWPRVVWWWNTRRKRFSCDKSLLRVEYRRLTSANVF